MSNENSIFFIGTFNWTREGGLYALFVTSLKYVPESDYVILNKRNVE